MFPEIDLKVPNFDRFNADLNNFEAAIKTKARRAGLVEMAKPVKKTIKAQIKDRSGALSRSIGHVSVRKGDKSTLGYGADDEIITVGSTRKVIGYEGGKQWQISKLRWLDEGTQPHSITGRRYGYLNIHGNKVSGTVMHPGIRARNILQRAHDQNKGQFEHLFEKGAVRTLRRWGARLG